MLNEDLMISQKEEALFVLSKYVPLIEHKKHNKGSIGSTISIPVFPEMLLTALLSRTLTQLRNCKPVLNIQPGVIVIGDLYGNLLNLIHLLSQHGMPPHQRYLFLGNIVNFGEFSLETITLVFSLLCCYPSHVHVLKGDSEQYGINVIQGLEEEITKRYQKTMLYDHFLTVFSYLPYAALFGEKILCAHSSTINSHPSMNELKSARNPSKISRSDEGYNSYMFDTRLPAEERLEQIIANNAFDIILLGGNMEQNGIQSMCSDKVFAIATCEANGAAGAMFVDGDLKLVPIIFEPNSNHKRVESSFELKERKLQNSSSNKFCHTSGNQNHPQIIIPTLTKNGAGRSKSKTPLANSVPLLPPF